MPIDRNVTITGIMELAGVASRDFDMCRQNYDSLPDEELNKRLNKLEEAAERIADWRHDWQPI